jgi:hypothetical protein
VREPASDSASTEQTQRSNESELRKSDVNEPWHACQTDMKKDRARIDNSDRNT